jgi:hypothetical protein
MRRKRGARCQRRRFSEAKLTQGDLAREIVTRKRATIETDLAPPHPGFAFYCCGRASESNLPTAKIWLGLTPTCLLSDDVHSSAH